MRKISKVLPKKYQQYLFIFFALALPVGYLNWYPLYPSYKEFIRLCEHDRGNILKTKQVDIIKVTEQHILNNYFRKNISDPIITSNKYQAFEYKGRKAYGAAYRKASKNWRVNISNGNLMPHVQITSFQNDYSIKSRVWLVKNSLRVEVNELIDSELGLMANSKNYSYYPYGNTWAKVLGLSSNNAPRKNCAERYVELDIFKIYLPLKE